VVDRSFLYDIFWLSHYFLIDPQKQRSKTYLQYIMALLLNKKMAQKETDRVLSELHANLAQSLSDLLSSGEASTADLNVIRQFLKDNQVSSQPVEDTPFGDLARSLPDIENVISLKNRRA